MFLENFTLLPLACVEAIIVREALPICPLDSLYGPSVSI